MMKSTFNLHNAILKIAILKNGKWGVFVEKRTDPQPCVSSGGWIALLLNYSVFETYDNVLSAKIQLIARKFASVILKLFM